MRIQAFIIKKVNTNEYDQQVVFFSKEFGKLTGVAKSILKAHSKQSMHLSELSLVDFELVISRGMPIITSAQEISSYSKVKESLPRLAIAYFLAEAIDALVPENEADFKLWQFITTTLAELEMILDINLPKFIMNLKRNLLSILGYGAENKEADLVFERHAGRKLSSLRLIHDVLE